MRERVTITEENKVATVTLARHPGRDPVWCEGHAKRQAEHKDREPNDPTASPANQGERENPHAHATAANGL